MIPPLQSLVKYDTPVLVSTTKEKKSKDKLGKRVSALSSIQSTSVDSLQAVIDTRFVNVSPTLRQGRRTQVLWASVVIQDRLARPYACETRT